MIEPSLCYDCPLPDCDDTSPRCPLRQASARYRAATGRKEPITDELRAARNEYFHVWKLEDLAKKSEAPA